MRSPNHSAMRLLAALVLLLAISACAPAVEELEPAEDKPLPDPPSFEVPEDASMVASRLESCVHFAGEFNGDQSARDKEVTQAMDELRCDTIESEAAAMRQKYPGNTAVTQALEGANAL